MIEFKTKEEEREFLNFYEYYKMYLDRVTTDEMPFLDEKDKQIHEIGIIHHQVPDALEELFYRVGVNSRNNIAVLYSEDDAFVGLKREKRDLVLVTNVDYLSPSLLMRALAILEYHLTNYHANPKECYYFGGDVEKLFIISGLNVKVLTEVENDTEEYKTDDLKINFLPFEDCYHYMQRFKGSSLHYLMSKLIDFNLECALPIVFVRAAHIEESKYIMPYNKLLELKKDQYYNDFAPFPTYRIGDKIYTIQGKNINCNGKNRVVPKYDIKPNGMLEPSEEDFLDSIKSLKPLEQELLKYIASITGYFVPCCHIGNICNFSYEHLKYCYDRNMEYTSGYKYDITSSDEIKELFTRLKSRNKVENTNGQVLKR